VFDLSFDALVEVELTGREVLLEDERDFGFDTRLEEPLDRHGRAIGVGHVVEEYAEVGLVDPELPLHGLRGEPDLAADDLGA
jgi:hypothetical protein